MARNIPSSLECICTDALTNCVHCSEERVRCWGDVTGDSAVAGVWGRETEGVEKQYVRNMVSKI